MKTKIDTKGLDQLLKAFRDKNPPSAKVGILGDKTNRKEKGTNAEIGAKHEFGNEGMPMRSFLRMPITNKLQEFLGKSGAFTKEVLAEVVRSGSLEAWLKKVGIVGEQCVAEAFATGGFGEWESWRTPGYENNTGQILVDTQQLRNSITSVVE